MFVITLGMLVVLASWVASLQSMDKLVDDSYSYDPIRPDGIQYDSDWMNDTHPSGPTRYNNTFHWTNTPQAKLIYFFQGNAIYYYADKDSSSAPTSITLDSALEEIVDATTPSAQGQQLIWSKTDLGSGDHQLVITHNGTSNQYLRLDYLR
ncbi:transmembrane protein [Ceratobasidium sp. AG-Ba]|nr:transmembrane protein [Ceratobasidium sp. AG-Ba]